MNGYSFRRSNSVIFMFASPLNEGHNYTRTEFAMMPIKSFNPLFTGRSFHCYMLDKSISQYTDIGSILLLLFFFFMENPVSKQCSSDQTPHDVASDRGLQCLPMTLLCFSRYERVKNNPIFRSISPPWKSLQQKIMCIQSP